jgi:hypothetical protein
MIDSRLQEMSEQSKEEITHERCPSESSEHLRRFESVDVNTDNFKRESCHRLDNTIQYRGDAPLKCPKSLT